jgi:hypothetical protein
MANGNVTISPPKAFFANDTLVSHPSGSNIAVELVDGVTGEGGAGSYEIGFCQNELTTFGVGTDGPALHVIKGTLPTDRTVHRLWQFSVNASGQIIGNRDIRTYGGISSGALQEGVGGAESLSGLDDIDFATSALGYALVATPSAGKAYSFAAISGGGGGTATMWYVAAGAPTTLHNNGDLYLNSTTGDVYEQTSGAWGSPIANIKGPAGTDGTNGSNGTNGTNGLNGSMWYVGSSTPTTLHNDGDLYLDSTTGEIYQQESSAWTAVANITGPAGGGASTLGDLTDIDFGTAGTGKVLADVSSGGKPYSFITPSGGGGGGGGGGTGGALPATYDDMVLAEAGLLYYWPFSDTSGSPHDLVFDRGLTVSGSPGYHAASLLANGDPAISFADNTSHLSFDSAMATRLSSPWTVEFFFSVPSIPTANVTLFNQESGGTTNFALVLLTSGELVIDIPDVSDTNVLSVTPGTAYHFALIYDGTSLYTWVNGTLTYIGNFSFTANSGAAPALIAGGPLTMQKLALYSLAVSKARLEAHYGAIAASSWSWPFPAASGSSDSTIDPTGLSLTTIFGGGTSAVVPLPAFTIPTNPGRLQFAAVVKSNASSAIGIAVDDGTNAYVIVVQTDGNAVCYRGANTSFPGTIVGAPYGSGGFNSNVGAAHRIAIIIDVSTVPGSCTTTLSTFVDGAPISTSVNAVLESYLPLKISILCAATTDVEKIYYDDQNILPEGSIGQGGTGGGGGGGDTELAELSDVAISSPTNGEVLTYDSTTGKWQNEAGGGGGGGVTSLEALTGALTFDSSDGSVAISAAGSVIDLTATGGGGGGGTAYDSVVLAQSPTHYWPLSDTAGSTTAADVVGSQPMTNGSTVTFGAPGLAQDGATSCFSAGSGGVLYIPSACQPTGNFSVSYLMAMAPNGPFANFAFGTTSAAFCIGAYSGGSGINFALLSQLVAWYQTVIPFNPGKVHIAVTNNGGNCSLYINGAEALNVGISITPQTVNGQILNAQGRMAKVGLWNGTVLTQAQILAQVAAAGL